MTLTFISNYINHHQRPFCDVCYAALGEDFHFVETMPMEAERRDMGWEDGEAPPYVVRAWEDGVRADELTASADVALVGWAQREDLVARRMAENKPTVRVSERIYRDGQWKAISPRGLVHKYREHIRYRKSPFYLLAIGAYTASDFRLIGAYPEKMYRWGYFPPQDIRAERELFAEKAAQETVQLMWAGRFLPLKHPEYALYAAKGLRAAGARFHLTMIGDGKARASLEDYAEKNGFADAVTFTGFLSPTETRKRMRAGHIFLFTSDHREGWGAVVSEAMGAGMAVVAGNEAGAPPVLIRHGENGLLFPGGSRRDFYGEVRRLVDDAAFTERLGRSAHSAIRDIWSAERAAAEFLRFCDCILHERAYDAPAEGPMSADPAWKPFVVPGE